MALPGAETQRKVREALGWCNRPEEALDVRVEGCWEKDGLAGEEISWSVGYGPRTQAWLVKPAHAVGPLPAVLALHDHGGFKYYGKEKIAEGLNTPEPVQMQWYQWFYGGRPWVNALAREGFAVLVHDTFLWGSRKFPLEEMPPGYRQNAQAILKSSLPEGVEAGVARVVFSILDPDPRTAGKGGRMRGTPRLPSSDSIRADSSPQM